MSMAIHETIVYDALEPCPYLEDQVSRLPLRYQRPDRLQASSMSPWDKVIEELVMFYRTNCPSCRACEPILCAGDEL